MGYVEYKGEQHDIVLMIYTHKKRKNEEHCVPTILADKPLDVPDETFVEIRKQIYEKLGEKGTRDDGATYTIH